MVERDCSGRSSLICSGRMAEEGRVGSWRGVTGGVASARSHECRGLTADRTFWGGGARGQPSSLQSLSVGGEAGERLPCDNEVAR